MLKIAHDVDYFLAQSRASIQLRNLTKSIKALFNNAEIVICHFVIARLIMFKQLGITSVELLLSLTIISSVSAYTLTMSEEVEKSIQTYQHESNVKDMLKKIKTARSDKALAAPNAADDFSQEDLTQPQAAVFEPANEAAELAEESAETAS